MKKDTVIVMMMKELQARSAEYVRGFAHAAGRRESDVPATMVHLMEELVEHASQVFNEMSGRSEADVKNIGEEMADIFMELCSLAGMYGIDIEKAVVAKMEKDKGRIG